MTYDETLAKKITGINDIETLRFYIDCIIDKISRILGYDILKHEEEEYINGLGKPYIYTNARPINTILQVIYNGNDITSDCVKMSPRRILTPYQICVLENIYVKYDAGYLELPKSIQLFIFEKVKSIQNSLNNAGLKSYSIESISYTFLENETQNDEFIQDVKNLFGGI